MNIGNLFVVAAPSGAGKTSLVTALVRSELGHVKVSISHTTRPARPEEQDGIHYHFVTQAEFKQLIAEEAFLEYAVVFGNYYGTTWKAVEQQLQQGYDVILEIDWQGAQQVRAKLPESTSIFIFPPSLAILRERLIKRAQDERSTIERRLAEAQAEIRHYQEFDYLIVNEHFNTALEDLKSIVRAQRLVKARQQVRYSHVLQGLLTE